MQKVEIEIGIRDRFSEEFKGIREKIGESGTLIDGMRQKAAELTVKFSGSVAEANRLREELRQAAESGAGLDELISRMEALEKTEASARDAGRAAMSAQTQYVKALQGAYGESSKEAVEAARANTVLFRATEEVGQRTDQTSQLLQKYKEKINEAAESTENLSEKSEKASKASKSLVDDISKIPGPVGEAARGVKTLTKETLVFLATPLGMTLAAISAGLALVSSWFHRTEEGEDALNVATARFTGTLNTLLDVADDVGGWLYKAFTDPLGAIDDLWHSLKDKVLADMKRVAEMGAGVVKIFSGDVSGGLAQTMSAWAGIGFGGIKKQARENADRQADIARRQNALENEQREWIVEREKKEARISELRAKIYDSTAKEAEKANAIKEAKKLTNELYDKEVSMARERYSIIADTNSLSHTSADDKRKENEALAKTISLERQRNDSLRTLSRSDSSLSNKAASAARKAANEAMRQAEAQEKITQIKSRQQIDEERAARDLEFSTREAEIKAMRDGTERKIAQIGLDRDREMVAITRAYEDLRQKRVEEAKRLWDADPKNKGRDFYKSDEYTRANVNTETEDVNRAAREKAAQAEYRKSMDEVADRQRQRLYDYIKEYGSIQEQKAAIAKEYDEKIAREGDAIQKAFLMQQKQRLVSELNFREMGLSIDWEAVFNSLERQSTQALRSLKGKLEQALDTKDITAENAKVLAEKIREIEDNLARRTDIVSAWLPGLRERERLTRNVLEAEKEIRGLQTAADTAGSRQESALKDFASRIGTTMDSLIQQFGEIDTGTLEEISSVYNISESSQAVQDAFALLTNTTVNLSKSQEDLEKAQKDREARQNALANFTKGGSVSQYFKDVTAGMDFGGYANLINTNVQSMAEFTDKIGLANTDFGDAVHGFADGVGGFNSAIQSLASGDVFGAVNGIIDGIQGFGKSIGAIFGINWSGGNEEEVARKDEELIRSNDGLQRSIDKLRESFDNANGTKAIRLTDDIVKKQEEYNRNIMERFANDMGYHSAHHSNEANWEGFSSEQIRRMNEVLRLHGGLDVDGQQAKIKSDSWRELTNLTPEALDMIRAYLPDVWDFITSRGNYGWVYDSLEEYADQTGKISEATEQLAENLSQLSKTSLHDSFASDLMDMKKDAKDFGNDFTEILMEAVLNAQVGNLMDDELEDWRQQLVAMMKENGGRLTADNVSSLRTMWDGIVEEGIGIRDEMAKVTGYDRLSAGQSAEVSAMGRLTTDQGDEVVGRLNAGQMIWQQGNDQRELILHNVIMIMNVAGASMGSLSELVSLQQTANACLDDIVSYSKKLYDSFEERMEDIMIQIKNKE